MYVNAYDPGNHGVYRRRRPRRSSFRRIGYLASGLLMVFAGFQTVSFLRHKLQSNAAMLDEFGVSTTPIVCTVADTEAPVISGVKDFVIYEGDPISYRSGVTVTDDVDSAPELTVDSSMVDLSAAGTYIVTYVAADAAGNRNCAAATVSVLPKKDGYVDLDTIYAAADETLETIITSDMTTRQQVRAIYDWARSNLYYSGHSDRADWRQTAYTMLTQNGGDCYGYFAVTKLFFERLGIPNIDVTKVKNYNGDSEHFWSLVSVDGGESYYHFDATPRVGQTEDFCLITDAALDAYSKDHKNCHNRDKSLYPTTPEV